MTNHTPQQVRHNPYLEMVRLELAFRFDDVVWLPPFRGSLWKGVLGPALKRLDATGQWQPPLSEGLPQSLYDWTYEAPASSCLCQPQHGAIPQPIVIDAPSAQDWTFKKPGKTMRIQLTLVGRFTNAWQALIIAFQDAGQHGIGKPITKQGHRGRATLISVHQVWLENQNQPKPLWNAENGWLTDTLNPVFIPPPSPCPVQINLVSPLRLERKNHPNGNKKQIIKPDSFKARDLFTALIRRVAGLMASQSGLVLQYNYSDLMQQTNTLRLNNQNFDWHDGTRWSGSQQSVVPTGGIMGHFDLDLTDHPLLFEFLWLAQWVNIGKGTFMGLGNIRLQPL